MQSSTAEFRSLRRHKACGIMCSWAKSGIRFTCSSSRRLSVNVETRREYKWAEDGAWELLCAALHFKVMVFFQGLLFDQCTVQGWGDGRQLMDFVIEEV